MLQRKVSLNDPEAVQYMYGMKKRNFSSHIKNKPFYRNIQ